ncbi:hypothetical protein AX15_001888 [Amanita polypyramis BW_CC]|nr:hypothetical protein AX15_001888 [Amanita polypyramis BW_CC]
MSQVFRYMFSLPVPESVEADGSSDKQPLTLDGIQKRDFIPLLRCLYPSQFQSTSNLAFSLEEWESVLKLSTLYEMAKVKAFSVEKMTPLLIESPTRQIYLSKTYDIKEWLALGVVRLANRTRPIDEEDVKIVGISDALKVCALREKRVQCGTCKARKNWGFEMKEVGEMFGICDTDLPSVVEGCEKCCNCSDDGPFFGQTSTTGGGGLFGRR